MWLGHEAHTYVYTHIQKQSTVLDIQEHTVFVQDRLSEVITVFVCQKDKESQGKSWGS